MTVALCTSRLQLLPLLQVLQKSADRNSGIRNTMLLERCCAGLHQREEGEGEAYDQPVA